MGEKCNPPSDEQSPPDACCSSDRDRACTFWGDPASQPANCLSRVKLHIISDLACLSHAKKPTKGAGSSDEPAVKERAVDSACKARRGSGPPKSISSYIKWQKTQERQRNAEQHAWCFARKCCLQKVAETQQQLMQQYFGTLGLSCGLTISRVRQTVRASVFI